MSAVVFRRSVALFLPEVREFIRDTTPRRNTWQKTLTAEARGVRSHELIIWLCVCRAARLVRLPSAAVLVADVLAGFTQEPPRVVKAAQWGRRGVFGDVTQVHLNEHSAAHGKIEHRRAGARLPSLSSGMQSRLRQSVNQPQTSCTTNTVYCSAVMWLNSFLLLFFSRRR